MKLKRSIVALLALVMMFAMAACGSSATPTDVVSAELDATKQEDVTTEVEEYLGSVDSAEGYEEQYAEFVTKIQEFDYEIVEENIAEDGETATVTVSITTYNFGKAYEEMVEQVLDDAQSGKIDASTDVEKYIYDMMFEKMLGLTEKDYTKEVVVNLTKATESDVDEEKGIKEGDWMTDLDENTDFQDALLGGAVTAVSEATN